MLRPALLVVALAPLAGAGCRAVLGIDELPAAPADASVLESGAEAAPHTDDAGANEAGADADAGPTWCDTALPPADYYCDDFDHLPIIDDWDNKNRTPDLGASNGGTIAADTTNSVSAPQSAILTMPTLIDKSRTASAFLQKSLHDAPPDMTIDLEIRIDTEDFPAGAGSAPLVAVTDQDGQNFIFILRRASGTWLAVNASGPLVQLGVPIPVGMWTDLQLSIKNHPVDADSGAEAGTDGSLTVRVNTRNAAVVPLPAVWQSITEQKLIVGPIASGPLGIFQMNVDNVRIWSRSDL
jgi:hypothetical protein